MKLPPELENFPWAQNVSLIIEGNIATIKASTSPTKMDLSALDFFIRYRNAVNLGRRDPIVEESLLFRGERSPGLITFYAIAVIKNAWREAERYIFQHESLGARYVIHCSAPERQEYYEKFYTQKKNMMVLYTATAISYLKKNKEARE